MVWEQRDGGGSTRRVRLAAATPTPGAKSRAKHACRPCVPLPKSSLSPPPHPCLFYFQEVLPLPGLQTCCLRDAAALPTPKQSWGCPEMGEQPPRPSRNISALEEGLGQRALALGNPSAPAPSEAGHRRLCTGGEPTTEILYLRHRGDSTALVVRTRSP